MADEEQLRILRRGVEAWNQWRREHPDVRIDLDKVKFRGVDLRRVNLQGANLSGADLAEADLTEANLREVDLSLADLSRAVLTRVNLHGANLSSTSLREVVSVYADFTGAHFWRTDLSKAVFWHARFFAADLSWANLSGTNFSEATVGYTVLCAVDLSDAEQLESVRHEGPSMIGIDTVYASRGRIPELFLRGAGVPDDFITYVRSLAGQAIEFYSCFISYSSKDQAFAERLHADLQAKGVRCWFAPEDVQGGRKLHEQIDEAIRYHDKLLLVLSENSMGSEWVKTEIRRARREEVKAGRRKLFPISLAPFRAVRDWEAFDADIGKDMAVEVREYFIPDFSAWKEHDAYRQAFERLVRDLKAG